MTHNLFRDVPPDLSEELVQTLAASDCVRIERIISIGHATAEGSWYEQEQSEWVIVLQGEARLRFEDDERSIQMRTGDHVNIPAYKKHRVEWTTPDGPTVWLAVHYDSSES